MGISFIIPFYDETIFLRQTLDSISAAGEIVSEIIIVNDRPTGNEAFLEDVASSNKAVSILTNDVNLGASGSRNRGIEHATGKHIAFIDSDDFYSPAALQALHKFATKCDTDMVHMPTLLMFPGTGEFHRYPRDLALLGSRQSRFTVQTNPAPRYAAASWAFLYKTDFLRERNVRFDSDLRKFEDHLFILNATQEAQSISTFDQWVHIWRRRGGSLSTGKMSWSDFDLQIESFTKCTHFLAKHTHTQGVEFQRDLSFCFSRFIAHWPLLTRCIAMAESTPQAQQTLNRLANATRRYRLLEDVCTDELFRALLGPKLKTYAGPVLDVNELPELYHLVSERDWPALARRLNPVKEKGSSSESSAPFKLKRKLNSLGNWSLVENNSRFNEAAFESEPKSANALELNPADLLWTSYVERLNRSPNRDVRLFSEYLLDELDSWIEALQTFKRDLESRSGSVAFEVKDSLVHDNFESTLRVFWDHRLGEQPKQEMTQPAEATEKRTIECLTTKVHEAYSTTAALFSRELGISTVSGQVSQRQTVIEAWRACEQIVLPNLEQEMSAELIARADSSRFGDADWWGKRTVKSRLRFALERAKGAITNLRSDRFSPHKKQIREA